MRIDWPDFEEQAAVQARVPFGDLRGFVEVFSENEPIAADDFLGFAERSICYHVLARDRLAFIRKTLSAFHFSFINQSIKPDVELINRALYFIPR